MCIRDRFTIPGMGKYFVDSISSRDYTILMGVTLFYAVIVVVMLFIVDLVYVLIDPRISCLLYTSQWPRR